MNSLGAGKKSKMVSAARKVLKAAMSPDKDDSERSAALNSLTEDCLAFFRDNDGDREQGQAHLIGSMIFGHSNFVAIMLDQEKQYVQTKIQLCRLVVALTDFCPDLIDVGHVPLLLGGYGARLSPGDVQILRLLTTYEKRVKLSSYFPLTWGKNAVARFAVKEESGTALWKRPKASEVLSLIHADFMIKSAINFSVHLGANVGNEDSDNVRDERHFYDPRFFLPLCCQICAPSAFVDRHLKLIESGMLAMVFASLSARDATLRSMGYVALARVSHQWNLARLGNVKKIWLHLFDVVRRGVAQCTKESSSSIRLPSIVTVFLIRSSVILFKPLDKMYKSISSFFLARPSLDVFTVPEFLRLFHSDDVDERNFILEVIRDGMKDKLDFEIAQKVFVFKMIMSFYGSVLADGQVKTKALIRQILHKAVGLVQPAFELVKYHGLNLWILAETVKVGDDGASELDELVGIAHAALSTMMKSLRRTSSRLPLPICYDFKVFVQHVQASSSGETRKKIGEINEFLNEFPGEDIGISGHDLDAS